MESKLYFFNMIVVYFKFVFTSVKHPNEFNFLVSFVLYFILFAALFSEKLAY